MILTKTPLRVSFFGGGSDLPSYYGNDKYGLCVSTTINSFIYLAVHTCVANHIKVIYSQLELVDTVDKIQHDRVRECLKYAGVKSNMEICSFSDVPVKGTGLGSSSTFTVGLLRALGNLNGISGKLLADMACEIEIEKCGEAIGKQDQYAAALGGFRAYRFTHDLVTCEHVWARPETVDALEESLLFFNTGISRNAASVLAKSNGDSNHITSQLVDMAE